MWGSTPIDEKRRGFTPMLVVMGEWFWEDDKAKPMGDRAGDKRRKPRY